MPGFRLNSMGEILLSAVDEVSVMDVYELAHDIGKATEQLIGAYGAEEPVQNLIQKVIVALELLEGFAEKNQQENGTVTELMERVDQLEAEKRQRSENRQKFEKEVETVEDQWRTESRELLGLVARLQEENKRLLLITANDDAGGITSSAASESGVDRLQVQLRDQMERHKNEMNSRDEQLTEKMEEIDNLHIQLEKWKATNVDAKRHRCELQAQIRKLCEERNGLIARIHEQHTDIVTLKRQSSQADNAATAEAKPVECSAAVETEDNKIQGAKSTTDEETSADEANKPWSDDDRPVQGPLPYEPDDAPWKRCRESGIRKFFRQLFLDVDKSSRTLVSLTKMQSSPMGF